MASAKLDLVRSIYAAFERGDWFGPVEWAHSEIEWVIADGPSPGGLTGVAAVEDNWRAFLEAWKDYCIEADEYRELDNERVLVLVQLSGRGKTSGLEMRTQGACLFHVHGGKVTRYVFYWDRDRALADLGLAPEADAADVPD